MTFQNRIAPICILTFCLLLTSGGAYAAETNRSGWKDHGRIYGEAKFEVDVQKRAEERALQNAGSGSSSREAEGGARNTSNDTRVPSGNEVPSRSDSTARSFADRHLAQRPSSAGPQPRAEPDSWDGIEELIVNGEVYSTRASMRSIPAPDSPAAGDPAEPAAAAAPETEAEEAPVPVVTLQDLQTMVAPESEIVTDQGGFGLKNGNTNFYASTAEAQTQSAEMLDRNVRMRVTPYQWVWDYGDGSQPVTAEVPGRAQDSFNEETPSSHVYAETGMYDVNLTTYFHGEYAVDGGPWIPVDGSLQVQADPVTADIYRSSTRNVEEACAAGSSSWGC